jgi:hypothetical protein
MLRYEHGLKISGWARKEKYHCDEWCVVGRETLEVRMNGQGGRRMACRNASAEWLLHRAKTRQPRLEAAWAG